MESEPRPLEPGLTFVTALTTKHYGISQKVSTLSSWNAGFWNQPPCCEEVHGEGHERSRGPGNHSPSWAPSWQPVPTCQVKKSLLSDSSSLNQSVPTGASREHSCLAEPCPNCRYVGKITDCCCLKPLSFTVVNYTATDNWNMGVSYFM